MPRFASPRGADDQAATCGRASRCPRPAALSIDLTGCSGAGRPRDGCRAAVWLPSCAIGHAGRAGVGDPQRFLRGRAGAHPAVKHRAPSAVAPAGSSSPPSGAGPIARAAPQIAEHPGPRADPGARRSGGCAGDRAGRRPAALSSLTSRPSKVTTSLRTPSSSGHAPRIVAAGETRRSPGRRSVHLLDHAGEAGRGARSTTSMIASAFAQLQGPSCTAHPAGLRRKCHTQRREAPSGHRVPQSASRRRAVHAPTGARPAVHGLITCLLPSRYNAPPPANLRSRRTYRAVPARDTGGAA